VARTAQSLFSLFNFVLGVKCQDLSIGKLFIPLQILESSSESQTISFSTPLQPIDSGPLIKELLQKDQQLVNEPAGLGSRASKLGTCFALESPPWRFRAVKKSF
jgi:hypothetical protein